MVDDEDVVDEEEGGKEILVLIYKLGRRAWGVSNWVLGMCFGGDIDT